TRVSQSIWKLFSVTETVLLENNDWEATQFSRVLRRIAEEDKDFYTYMYNISRTLFKDRLYELEFDSQKPIPELDYKAIKNDHQFWLGIGKNLGRALYGSLLGTALLKYSTLILTTSININIFIFIIFICTIGFFGIIHKSGKIEERIQNLRNSFVDISHKTRKDQHDFVKDLTYYLKLEFDLTSEKYSVIVNFSINILITSLLTGYYTLISVVNSFPGDIIMLILFKNSLQIESSIIIWITFTLTLFTATIGLWVKIRLFRSKHHELTTNLSTISDNFRKIIHG
ncbi:MAG: hypothetical protein ACFFDT_26900, partial [Candidatus Hodarchaeota archaeon]